MSKKKSYVAPELNIKLALSEILFKSGLLLSTKLEHYGNNCVKEGKMAPEVDADQVNTTASSSSSSLPELSCIPTFERLLPHPSRTGIMGMRQKLFNDLKFADRMCAKVARVGVVVLELELICMLDHFRRCLYFMQDERFTVDYDRTKRVYCVGDYVAVSVARLDKSLNQLELRLNHEEAILQPNDLPSYYRNFAKQSSYNESASIAKMKRNPNLNELLRVEIDSAVSGLTSIGATTPMESAEELRVQQNRNLAMVHVSRGAELTRQNKCFEAIQCFNKALTVDETCADAYVGRGAACAGSNNFSAALKDLEKALELDPRHKNAARYSLEVLLAHARELEKDGNKKEALQKYQKALEFSSHNQTALAAIKRLGGGVEVIDISMEDEGEDPQPTKTPTSNGRNRIRSAKRRSSEYGVPQTPEVNKRKLEEMEAFIEKLKRSK